MKKDQRESSKRRAESKKPRAQEISSRRDWPTTSNARERSYQLRAERYCCVGNQAVGCWSLELERGSMLVGLKSKLVAYFRRTYTSGRRDLILISALGCAIFQQQYVGRVISPLLGHFANLLRIYLRGFLSGISKIITIRHFKQWLEYSKHSINVTYKTEMKQDSKNCQSKINR